MENSLFSKISSLLDKIGQNSSVHKNMESIVNTVLLYTQHKTFAGFWLSLTILGLLGLLLIFGRRLEPAIRLERLGIPIALLVGLIGLLIGPYGPIPLMPQSVTDLWVNLPTPLLTIVFAGLMLGRPLPETKGLVKPVASQISLGLLFGFGQYFVGGLAVIFLLAPLLSVDPLMACLIEVGFEGGHGAAAVMGSTFRKLGFPGGLDLGLAMATIGLLFSTIIGSALVVFGRWRGWLTIENDIARKSLLISDESDNHLILILKKIFSNLALLGIAVLLAIFTLKFLKLLEPFFGQIFRDVLEVFPVFPLALLASLAIRYLLEKFKGTHLVSELLQREISTLATDLLIATAIASINLPLLTQNWITIVILSLSGLSWNLFGMLFLARNILKEEWFERSLTEFGNATGVSASGLLLLRLSDPTESTKTLPIFSIKQLFLQPLLSGGLVTVLAPLFLLRLGLIGWTEICGVLTTIFVISSIIISRDVSD